MKKYLLTFIALGALSSYAKEVPDLRILTYEGVSSEWGVGPKWQKGFEEQCGCTISFSAVNGGSASIITRATLDSNSYDILLGIDNSMMADARRLGLIQSHQIELPELAINWTDKDFIPFDYGYLAFVGRKGETLPQSFDELITNQNIKIVMEDPKTSGFAHWIYGVYGENTAEKWNELKKHITTITPSWSEAYKIFLDGEADVVVSYSTSPAYHIAFEKNDGYQSLIFPEGHYEQIEVAAISKTSQNPELARQFLKYILSPEAQKELPLTNFMYPSLKNVELPDAFKGLKIPTTSIYPTVSNQEIGDIWVHDIAQ
ncbi:MAG: thiamine ABC transporter substrate binding subunit [Alphaproteobacteria bacterium]